jgi:hypothetical protein
VHRAQTVLAALKARLMAAADTRRAYADDGSKTAAAWLAKECNAAPAAIRREALVGRRLRKMPSTDEAFATGAIGADQVLVLTKLASSPRAVVAISFPEAEGLLVGFAKDLPFDDFVIAAKHWESTVDPDGAEDDADRFFERRRVRLSQVGDQFVLEGQFDVVQGTEIHTALTRIAKELREQDRAAFKDANGGVEPTDDQLPRTPAQRWADALAEMARRAMAMPKGARLPEPLVTVVVGLESLTGKVCELFNKQPVTPGQVARVLDRSEIERVVFDSPNRVIEVGKRRRFFTGGLRRAIEVRDRHCQHPGCREPAEWCQADHIQPHGWGGLTVQVKPWPSELYNSRHGIWRQEVAGPRCRR